jgi:hypothetical protein
MKKCNILYSWRSAKAAAKKAELMAVAARDR